VELFGQLLDHPDDVILLVNKQLHFVIIEYNKCEVYKKFGLFSTERIEHDTTIKLKRRSHLNSEGK
jgi:hypothetical protein